MKKFLSLVLALVMTMSLVTISAGAKDFTDNSKITYKEAVDVVSALKIVDGYEDGAFNPTNNLTRGAAAKIICNLILGPTTASALSADTAPFKDVPTTNNFAGYIAYCSQQGIISGYADGTFRPAAPLTGYAFMKMLLGALGYDAAKEGYTGANWSVQVGKQALGVGLDDGNDDFVGTEPVNREEACLYAFNTLQATMVEYENQSQIVIGDITVNTSSKYKDMANTSKTDGYIDDNDKMEFAEKYFTDLKLKNGEDDFARPANVWTLKADEIGTYAKTPNASYTKKVEVGDIYKDLGLSSTVAKADVFVYANGVEMEKESVAIKKGDDDNKYGANGVLTEVFYDDDAGEVTITKVNYYVGQVSKTVAETSKKDAYVVVTTLDGTAPKNGNLEFETPEEFEDDAYVVFTYSESADEVKSVENTEEVTGTTTKVINKVNDEDQNNGMTLDGTEYKMSKNNTGETLGNVSVKNDYTVYLDNYGYIIYIEEAELGANDYALVRAVADKGSFVGKKADLVFADGTTAVVTTDKNYSTGSNAIDPYTIVSYKVDDDGVYTLKKVSNTVSNTDAAIGDTDTFEMVNDKASITVATGTVVTSNSKTVFVVQDPDDADDYTSYTGIKNAPSVKAGTKSNQDVTVYYYCKSGKMLTVMFILPDSGVTVDDNSSNLLFLAGKSVSDLIHDSDGDYFEYDAVVDGEITTVKVDEDVVVDGSVAKGESQNGLYKSYSTSKGIITKLTSYDAYSDGEKQETLSGTGVNKRSADYTVILNTAGNPAAHKNEVITVDDDAQYFYVDKKGNISTSSYRGVVKDDNDKVYAVIKDYLVQALFVQEVEDGGKDDETVYSTEAVVPKGAKIAYNANGTIDLSFYVEDPAVTTLSITDIYALLQADGCSDITFVGGKWAFTKSGLDYSDMTVNGTRLYKVTLGSTVSYEADAATVAVAKGTNDKGTGYIASVDGGENYSYADYGTDVTVAANDVIIETGYVEVADTTASADVSGYTNTSLVATASDDLDTAYAKVGSTYEVTVMLTGNSANTADAEVTVTATTATVSAAHVVLTEDFDAQNKDEEVVFTVTVGEDEITAVKAVVADYTPPAP